MPSKQPKISILLATRNGATFLREQLDSYRAQTYSNWELLVSDDGSTDKTMDIIREFAADLPQSVIIVKGPQEGFWSNFVSTVRNDATSGDFFAFSDQDDIWMPDKLEKAIAWFSTISTDQPAVYFTRTELVDVDGAHIGFSPLFKRAPSFQNAIIQNIGGGNTMMFNRAARSALRETPRAMKLVSHDWWVYQVVTAIGGTAHYDAWPSLRYRQHGQNIVGANVGARARWSRLTAFFHGRFSRWNDVNIMVLDSLRHQITPGNALTLDRFSKARRETTPKRLWLLWSAGVYRQSTVETMALYVGAILGRF